MVVAVFVVVVFVVVVAAEVNRAESRPLYNKTKPWLWRLLWYKRVRYVGRGLGCGPKFCKRAEHVLSGSDSGARLALYSLK